MFYICLVNFIRVVYKSNSMKFSAGSVIDELLEGGFETDIINTVYGPAGSGKTNICIISALKAIEKGKKVIYIDTEGGFSIERFKQLCNDVSLLDNILFFKPTCFEEQKEVFLKLRKFVNKRIGLIVVDTISMLYRLELGQAEEVYAINRELGKQISYLNEIARKQNIPILIANQVYADFENKNQVNIVGGDLLKYGSKCLVELQIVPGGKRRAILKKHRSMEEKEIIFTIKEKGIFKSKLGLFYSS